MTRSLVRTLLILSALVLMGAVLVLSHRVVPPHSRSRILVSLVLGVIAGVTSYLIRHRT